MGQCDAIGRCIAIVVHQLSFVRAQPDATGSCARALLSRVLRVETIVQRTHAVDAIRPDIPSGPLRLSGDEADQSRTRTAFAIGGQA